MEGIIHTESDSNPANEQIEGKDSSYFHYYAHLQHQQNMLQDFVRTNTYKNAISNLGNVAIKDKIVMDVGSGSGILSYFAVQSGAKRVYAIEASEMADKMQVILSDASSNPQSRNKFLKDKIQIVKNKIEEIEQHLEMVDTIISEPIGVLLVHERMIKMEGIIHTESDSNPANEQIEGKDSSYFHYYAHLQHQQNMLQDFVRTNTYKNAISNLGNVAIKDKIVMDVGSGSGILSYFAVQSGAKRVYAIEASEMADKMQVILSDASSNPQSRNKFLKDKIQIVKNKIEEIEQHLEMVDTIISEPIGVLLVHERMVNKYLKPNGTMAPSLGTICLAPITDSSLWGETMQKARFWQQQNYYSIDLSPLARDAFSEYFTSPVVGCFNPNSIISSLDTITRYDVDFYTISMDQIKHMTVPICWDIKYTGVMHAVAGWFDLEFNLCDQVPVVPSDSSNENQPVALSTGPSSPPTHWQQVRFLLPDPIAVNYGQRILGKLSMIANSHRSYDLHLDINLIEQRIYPTNNTNHIVEVANAGSSNVIRTVKCSWKLQEQIYNYSYNSNDYHYDSKPEALNLYSPESNNLN
ncbi:Histone-arginine methyltransferase CARMER [Smittium mucronatum]|uniref:type I protein arginine methyltransferase n=1 Tax=Smittium mucronatum TaxID=133383 RepID=A0A1R0H0N8_9FUNG|nr:Histone-arginine methyltransferase CARMER [Smittium mucronatum]